VTAADRLAIARTMLDGCRDTCGCGYEDIGEPGVPRRWFCELPVIAEEVLPLLLAEHALMREALRDIEAMAPGDDPYAPQAAARAALARVEGHDAKEGNDGRV